MKGLYEISFLTHNFVLYFENLYPEIKFFVLEKNDQHCQFFTL